MMGRVILVPEDIITEGMLDIRIPETRIGK